MASVLEERKARQRRIKFRNRIIVVAVLILALSGTFYFSFTKLYTVEDVEINGNELYSDEKIKEIIFDDEYSWSTLYVYFKNRFSPEKELAFVDSVEVKMDIKRPHYLSVNVVEKAMLGCMYIPAVDQYAFFDREGFVIETSKETIKGIPVINGFSPENVVLYEKLPIDNDDALSDILNLTQLLNKYYIPVKEIKYDTDTFKMTAVSGKIKISVGTADNLSDKISRLQYIMPSLEGKKGTLHLENWSTETTDIVFDPD